MSAGLVCSTHSYNTHCSGALARARLAGIAAALADTNETGLRDHWERTTITVRTSLLLSPGPTLSELHRRKPRAQGTIAPILTAGKYIILYTALYAVRILIESCINISPHIEETKPFLPISSLTLFSAITANFIPSTLKAILLYWRCNQDVFVR